MEDTIQNDLILRKQRLMTGIRLLRVAAGEKATTKLIRGNIDKRKEMFVQLMKSGNEDIYTALAYILSGLGIEPEDYEDYAS